MRIKLPSVGEQRGALDRLRALAGRPGWIALAAVVLFGAGVAAQRSALLRSGLDLVSRETLTHLVRRARGYLTQPERLTIDIAHKDFMNLAHQRDIALERQVLIVSDDQVVPATVRLGDRAIPVRLRLKGDLVDHLQGDKWSFRVIARRDSTILGMKQFSLQHPQTRDFLNEKVYHDAMRREGIVALRYQFVDLTVNGKSLGIYALEEAFETRLVENNDRKDGPILRFNEDILWGELARQTTLDPRDRGAVAGAGSYTSSDIDAFQTSAWLATPEGKQQYLTAVQLLEGFRRGTVSVADAFDVGRLARFFALSDLLRGWHGAANWPNARFYFNPITSRLEPVAFDAYNRQMPARPGLLALQAADESREPSARQYIARFFSDTAFYRRYVAELERVSDSSYVRALAADLEPGLKGSLAILRREFPALDFSWEPLQRSANFIQIALSPPRAVQAYYRAAQPGQLDLEVANMQAFPLRVVGLARDSFAWPGPAIDLPGKTDGHPLSFRTARFQVPARMTWPDTLAAPLRVRYQVAGSERVDEADVLPWPHDGLGETALRDAPPRQEPNLAAFPFMMVDEARHRIAVRPGAWRLDRNMIVPAGYVVFAGPGTRLDLVNGATIVSRSALEFRGTQEAPIIIESSDGTGQGLLVLQAGDRSQLDYVEFSGQSNPTQQGWSLTGAVTFYESPVDVTRSLFRRNRSEDALHIMRTTFSLESVTFEDTQADALDIDFGKGSMRRVTVLNAGNDGVDVSGSVVDVEDLTVRGSGDKGLSAGEGSQLNVRNVKMTDAIIGLASKDRSVIRGSGLEVIGGQIGVTAYLKKAEYGPASIDIRGLVLRGQELPFLVERFSTVTVDGRVIPADRERVADILYGAVYGKASR